MYNYAEVNHFGTRNKEGVAFMLKSLAKIDASISTETTIGYAAMSVLKTLARKVFGSLPLFRTRITDCGVETFQTWYNDLAEVNNMKPLRNTGVWDEATAAAFNSIVMSA
jgi:hypothetical protein